MIYVFLANGFEEIEAFSPIDILRRAGFDVCTVAVGTKDNTVFGSHGIAVTADKTENEIKYDAFCEAVILPGGVPGTPNLYESSVVREFVLSANGDKKIIGAICAAPSILGKLGLLEGKIATCYPGYENELKGAEICSESCCISDNIVTAKGAGVALEFSFALADAVAWNNGSLQYGDFSLSSDLEGKMQCDR